MFTVNYHWMQATEDAVIVEQVEAHGGIKEPYIRVKFGWNMCIMCTPNQALALRDALANDPDLAAYETACEKEEAGREQGPCVGDVEYSSEVG